MRSSSPARWPVRQRRGERETGEGLPVAGGNSIRLQQACLNVLINGIQQMAAPRSTVRTAHLTTEETVTDHGSRIQIRIADTGPGIHHSLWDRVFNLGFTTRGGDPD